MANGNEIKHYYGDVVRKLFLTAAIAMLVFLPFFRDYIPLSINVSLFVILTLAILAGITNPKQLWGAALDTFTAFLGSFAFGFEIVDSYILYGVSNLYFWVNQILGVIFLIALYFSVKTLRGFIVKS